MGTQSLNRAIPVYIGSYAEPTGPGLYACHFDPVTGQLELIQQLDGLANPTFLDIDAANLRLYTLMEVRDEDGRRTGGAAVFAIDPDSGRLTELGRARTVPATTCHISLDRTGRCLLTASYHGGMIGLNPVFDNGLIGDETEIHRHSGSSVLPVQNQPRPHSAFLSPDNRYVVVPDLGADKVFIYKLDTENRSLQFHREVPTAPGAGPRHFAFHPSRRYGYVINELNSTVIAYTYDEANGELVEKQTVSTLPASHQGENACAHIELSPDGRFLYASNRGHDSIAIFAVNPEDGLLEPVDHVSVLGQHPRHFTLSPDGAHLLVANRDTNNVTVFARDEATGRLTPTGGSLNLSKPVCVRFLAQTR